MGSMRKLDHEVDIRRQVTIADHGQYSTSTVPVASQPSPFSKSELRCLTCLLVVFRTDGASMLASVVNLRYTSSLLQHKSKDDSITY
jgi:hypothetical protein